MKKFKRWLIHKLGGMCYDDAVRPVFTSEKKKIETLLASVTITRDEVAYAKTHYNDIFEKEVVQTLTKKLAQGLTQYVTFFNDAEEQTSQYYVKYYAKIEVVDNSVKGDKQ